MWKKRFGLIMMFAALSSCDSANPSTSVTSASGALVTRRATFDLGSGAYKMRIGDVNKGLHTVRFVELPLDARQKKIDSSIESYHGANGALNETYKTDATRILVEMIATAKRAGAIEFEAVATGIFRDGIIKNPEETRRIARSIEKAVSRQTEINFKMKIVTAKEESIMGYYNAAALSGLPRDRLVMWDIGGKTMQFATMVDGDKFKFFSNGTASATFKQDVITKCKRDATLKSPNPLASSEAELAVTLASQRSMDVPEDIRRTFANREIQVVGVGGVHAKSVANQVRQKFPEMARPDGAVTYTTDHLRAILDQRVQEGANDDVLKVTLDTAYPEIDVSNVALVLGYMQGLGISKVTAYDVTNADALMIYIPSEVLQ